MNHNDSPVCTLMYEGFASASILIPCVYLQVYGEWTVPRKGSSGEGPEHKQFKIKFQRTPMWFTLMISSHPIQAAYLIIHQFPLKTASLRHYNSYHLPQRPFIHPFPAARLRRRSAGAPGRLARARAPADLRAGAGTRAGEGVLGKGAGEGFLAADLLAADEALDGDGDGAVDVLRGAVLGETHAAEGLADADDGFEMTDLEGLISDVVREERASGGELTVMG